MAPYKKQLEEFSSVEVGRAAETLVIRREAESLLGNFVADAMVRSCENITMEDSSKIRNVTLTCHELTFIRQECHSIEVIVKGHRDNRII